MMQPCWINLLNLIVYFYRLLSVSYIDDDIYKQWQFINFFSYLWAIYFCTLLYCVGYNLQSTILNIKG